MPQLRWTLLVLGVLFLVGLAWWELRRPRQARRTELAPPLRAAEPPAAAPETEAASELILPEIHVREPVPELPSMDVTDESLMGLRVDGRSDLESEGEEELREELEAGEAIVPAPRAAGDALLLRGGAAVPAAPLAPIVEWPDEAVRQVIALRLVAPTERFSGRAVRQALAAEGFVLGKFSIFHRAGPDGRCVVSAANLLKPGTFDSDALDMQRVGGLNLFAVLPGPLPAARALEELLTAARNLNERLQGALQDERGEPLTSLRATAMREALAGSDESSGAPAA